MPLDKPKAPFSLPKLPYEENALEPVVSAKTISFHYGKHHKAYVDNLNELVVGTPYEQHGRSRRSSRSPPATTRTRGSSTTPARSGTTTSTGRAWRRRAASRPARSPTR